MSGRVVFRPEPEHHCAPGWTTSVATGAGPFGLPAGHRIAHPPDPNDYPAGTVWECECGTTWVSTEPVARNSPGIIDFRPERRRELRRRLRGAR